MNTASLETKFEDMRARLKVGELRPRRWQRSFFIPPPGYGGG